MTVEIRETPIGGDLKDFVDVVDYIYRDDPKYVRPLDADIKGRLATSHPFFEHAEGVVLTAYRNGWCIGRCTAQIDHAHLARYRDDVGFFGFLDTVDDEEVARALLDRARHWLGARGMKSVRGPMSLGHNQEVGCLVEGFDSPPMIMMPHHLPYQGKLIETAGFSKVKDLYAWRYDVGTVSKRVQKGHDDIEALPEVMARHIDPRRLDAEVRDAIDIFNDAWSENWGFVPLTESELTHLAKELKLILVPELTYLAYVDGEPAAVAIALPNVNEVIADLKGKLFPFGLFKLLYRLKVKHTSTARLSVLGIKKKFRNVRKYAGLSIFLYCKLTRAGERLGVRWGELSWTLEDNGPVNVAIKMMGAKLYKTYRLYERPVD